MFWSNRYFIIIFLLNIFIYLLTNGLWSSLSCHQFDDLASTINIGQPDVDDSAIKMFFFGYLDFLAVILVPGQVLKWLGQLKVREGRRNIHRYTFFSNRVESRDNMILRIKRTRIDEIFSRFINRKI